LLKNVVNAAALNMLIVNVGNGKMRKGKYDDKSAPMKFFHTYTGYIVVTIVLLTIALGFYLYFESLPFYESWSCDELRHYMLGGYSSYDVKPHSELTEAEHLRLHQVYAECSFSQEHD
jgi:hypothetical protein